MTALAIWFAASVVVGVLLGRGIRNADERAGITRAKQDAQQAAQLDRADPRAGDRSWW